MSSTYTKLLYHCIFSTKNRRAIITKEIRERLYPYIGGILSEHRARLVAGGGTEDHVHLLLELPATLAVADAMRVVKANSSKWVRETFPTAVPFAWQTGYAAFTVSESSADTVVRYIERQVEHHQGRGCSEELIGLLRRHRIDYEERYV